MKHSQEASSITPGVSETSKVRIVKNLLVLSFTFLILIGSYNSLILLQSTLNSLLGIGVISVAVQFGCGSVSSLLFPKYVIGKLGCKTVITVTMVMFIPYILANFYPNWILMILTSILIGLCHPLLFAALCAYLNNLSNLYTDDIISSQTHWRRNLSQYAGDFDVNVIYDRTESQHVLRDSSQGRSYNTISEMQNNSINEAKNNKTDFKRSCTPERRMDCFPEEECDFKDKQRPHRLSQTSHFSLPDVTLTSSHVPYAPDPKVLNDGNRAKNLLESTTARFFGFHGMIYQTGYIWCNLLSYYVLDMDTGSEMNLLNGTYSCGASFCLNRTEYYEEHLQMPSHQIRYSLIGAFLALGVVAVLLVVLFLDKLESEEEAPAFSLDLLMATYRQMKKWNQVLLTPLALYVGILQAFSMADFTQAYIACEWDIQHVGLVSACFGVTLSISSCVSGWFVKYLGRLLIFLLMATMNVAICITMLLWNPDSERPTMIFLVGGMLGFVTGTYWSQLRAFYGVLFKDDQEAAFVSYQLWHAIGACLGFACSSYLCTTVKICLLLGFSTVAIVGYIIVEIRLRRNGAN